MKRDVSTDLKKLVMDFNSTSLGIGKEAFAGRT